MCKFSCWVTRNFAGLLKLLSKGAQLATAAKMLFVVVIHQIVCSFNANTYLNTSWFSNIFAFLPDFSCLSNLTSHSNAVLCGTEISSGTPNSISQISRCKIFTKKNYDSKITCGKYLENYHLPLCLFAYSKHAFQ